MKTILPKPGAFVRRLFRSAKTKSGASPAEQGDAAPRTLTQEHVQSLIEQALEEQRRELKAELAEAVREEVEALSVPTRELYASSLETQRRLIQCSDELRQEVLRFADTLVARVNALEERAGNAESILAELEGARDAFVERFSEELAELGESIETANHSFFRLHRATGRRIDELVRDHKADLRRLSEETDHRAKSDVGIGGRVTSFLGQRLRAVRSPAPGASAT